LSKAILLQTGSLFTGFGYDGILDEVDRFGLDYEELRGIQVVDRYRQLAMEVRDYALCIDNGGVLDINAGMECLTDLAKARSRRSLENISLASKVEPWSEIQNWRECESSSN